MASSERPAALGIIGFMVAAVLFAGLAGVLLSKLLENEYTQEPVLPVVVVVRNVPAGEKVTDKDLAIAHWPQSAIPVGAFTNKGRVIEAKAVPLIPLVKGEAILRSHLSKANSGMGIASLIGPNQRAMSVRVDDAVALARLVYPGARVDVLSTVAGSSKVTKIVLQNVKVLAVGEDIDPLTISRRRRAKEKKAEEEGGASAFNPNDEDSKEMRGVITLEVSAEEAERLTLAARDGSIDIALRNPKNDKIAATSGITRLALMGAEEGGPNEQWAGMLVQSGAFGSLQSSKKVRPINRRTKRKSDGASRASRRRGKYTGKATIAESPNTGVKIIRNSK